MRSANSSPLMSESHREVIAVSTSGMVVTEAVNKPLGAYMNNTVQHIVSSLIFSAIGIVVFAIAFLIMSKVTPFSLRKEIEEDQNTALAIVIGSVIIGIALIIAAAVFGG